MHFISNDLERYIEAYSSEEPELLRRLRRETHLKVVQPRMLSGHIQGRLLSLLSRLMAPRRILEIGTYTGYSALCLAEGLAPDGQLHTLEINPELAPLIERYFSESTAGDRLRLHTGHALDLLKGLPGPFDLVFIDGKKEEYMDYFDAIYPKVRDGGLILSDNILWSGKVAGNVPDSDRATRVLQEYNRMLSAHPDLHTVILPLRDGLTMSYKLPPGASSSVNSGS